MYETKIYSLLFTVSVIISIVPALAHQPFFEEKDFTADSPAQIKDPTISTAMYASLETPSDVDYYSFNGSAGHWQVCFRDRRSRNTWW